MTDIEIANSIEPQDICELAKKLEIKKDYIEREKQQCLLELQMD